MKKKSRRRAMKFQTFTVLGRKIRFRYGRTGYAKTSGWYDPNTQDIVVSSTLRHLAKLDRTLHELFHHVLPHFDEAVIEQLGEDVAAVLWQLRYRDTTHGFVLFHTHNEGSDGILGIYRTSEAAERVRDTYPREIRKDLKIEAWELKE